MSTSTGKVRVSSDGTTKTFTVVDTPDESFIDPPTWVWELVKGNAGCDVTVVFAAGPPKVISTVTVG